MRLAHGTLLLAAALAAAAEPELPIFRAEALNVSVRLPLADGAVQPDHRLTLIADLPRTCTVLRLSEPRFAPVATDTGERLGLLVRPANRIQNVILDRQAGRERVLRLNLDLTPPAAAIHRLTGVSGHVQVVLGQGVPQSMRVPVAPRPLPPMRIAGLDDASVQVEDAKDGKFALILPKAFADRVARIGFTDPAGATAAVKPGQNRTLDDGSLRLAYDPEATGAATAVIAWYPELATVDVTVVVPELAVPGGIPGIGDATAAAPALTAPPPAPKPPFLRAVHDGDLEVIRRLLAKDRALLEAAEGDGRRAIHRAAALGRPAVLAALLDAGAERDARTKDGLSALECAIAAGDPGCTALLLDRGADPLAAHPATGWTPLHRAVNAGAAPLVDLLLQRGADPLARAKDGRSSQDLARDQSRWTILRRLLGNPAPGK